VLAVGLALGLTVWFWSRGGRARYVVRPAGILLTEALLLLTVGLVVNRSEQFYPDWAALTTTQKDPEAVAYQTAAGDLDTWLATTHQLTFIWQPPEWREWNLAAAPTVTVPVGYLEHPAWRYPVVLTTVPGQPVAVDAIAVYVVTRSATSGRTLGAVLPAALARELRVTAHRWAFVVPGADLARASAAAAAQSGRYPVIACVGRPGRPIPLPAGVLSTSFEDVTAAVGWAVSQLPPPLAGAAPPVTSLPVQPKASASPGPFAPPGAHPARRFHLVPGSYSTHHASRS
jgi:hypothetical protein